ncbi:MAG: hypothetical protein JWM41_4592 [Gemmatimonadetes bacterium]|nr:hypothetical protein [Gemmatimonadota bacterium]
MTDLTHDPGHKAAGERTVRHGAAEPLIRGGTAIRVGTASWTDRTMTAKGVFYPDSVKTPEARLRHYATRFSMVEADAGFYAIPDPQTAERWVERTPDNFVFNVKAHALMTGHATEISRLPRSIREALPPSLAAGPRVYAKDLPLELRDEVWRLFRNAVTPLHESGKLGAILLQFAPWVRPERSTPAMLARARDLLGDLPIAVEFRHPSWLEARLRERVWAQLREQHMTYVVADTPPGAPTSLPLVPAVTTSELAIVRLHGRRSELWGASDAPVVEKYRYLYDPAELEEWLSVILELSGQTEQLHIVFSNCYANYGATNALEMAELIAPMRNKKGPAQ